MADRILVLRRGELVDQGTHDELMARSVDYRRIFAGGGGRGTTGGETPPLQGCAADMGFIMDGLESEAYDRNYPDRELVRRVLAYFKPHVRKLLLVAAAITLNSLALQAARSSSPAASTWCR